MARTPSRIDVADRKRRHARMLLLYTKGWTHREIAADPEVNCSLDWVYKSIPKLLDNFAKEMIEVSKREVVTQIGQMLWMYSEASKAWERSCETRTETTDKTEGEFGTAEDAIRNRPGKLKTVSSTTKTQGLGDPRYLEQMRAIKADIRRLLRLDKDDNLQEVLANISFTQVNVNAPNALMPVVLPGADDIAGLMAKFGMNPDGTARPLATLPADAQEDVVSSRS